MWYSFVCAYIPHCQFPLVRMVKSGIFVGKPQSPMFLDVKSSVFIVPFQFHSSFRWVQIISSHFKSLQHVQKFLNIPSLHPKTTSRGEATTPTSAPTSSSVSWPTPRMVWRRPNGSTGGGRAQHPQWCWPERIRWATPR